MLALRFSIRQPHPPFRKVMHRRGADELHETFGHHPARRAALPRQPLDGPVERRPRMDQRQGLADGGIAQTGEPARILRRQRFNVAPHDVDEHQFAELGQNAFAAGALLRDLGDREMDELPEPAIVVAVRIAGEYRRQCFQQD